MELKHKYKQIESGLRRGWVVSLLYLSHPKPMDCRGLIYMLDFYNFPMSRHRLAEKIEFLRGLRLIRVFPAGSEYSLSDVEQAKLIQRFADSEGEMDSQVCVSLTTKGINFQEGHFEEVGVSRVN